MKYQDQAIKLFIWGILLLIPATFTLSFDPYNHEYQIYYDEETLNPEEYINLNDTGLTEWVNTTSDLGDNRVLGDLVFYYYINSYDFDYNTDKVLVYTDTRFVVYPLGDYLNCLDFNPVSVCDSIAYNYYTDRRNINIILEVFLAQELQGELSLMGGFE